MLNKLKKLLDKYRDKINHFGVCQTLTLLLSILVTPYVAAVIVFLIGLGWEVVGNQDGYDMLADMAGIASAIFFVLAIKGGI